MASVIELHGVSKCYELFESARQRARYLFVPCGFSPQNNPTVSRTVLESINLEIEAGEKVGIIGHNGSGKSTLLRLILGLSKPTAGEVIVRGKVHGLLSVGGGYDEQMTGLEAIENILLVNGLSGDELRTAVRDVVDFVELGKYLHHPVRTYSLGMKARLEFAASTAISPDILAIDEVLGAGDGYFAQKSARRMRELTSNTTLLLVSHSMTQILDYCDRVVWLNDGKVAADGDAESVIKAYEDHMMKRESLLLDRVREADRIFSDVEGGGIDDALACAASRKLFEPEMNCENSQKILIRRVDFGRNGGKFLISETGEPLDIRITIEVIGGDSRPVTVELFAFSPAGQLIWDARSEPVSLCGRIHMINISTKRANAGVGDYIITVVVAEEADCWRVLAAEHAALILRMKTTNYSDPPLFHCESTWFIGNSRNGVPGRINAWS